MTRVAYFRHLGATTPFSLLREEEPKAIELRKYGFKPRPGKIEENRKFGLDPYVGPTAHVSTDQPPHFGRYP